MTTTANEKVPSGVPGLDPLLNGGLITKRCYLVRGAPGAGKTTFGLHFLTPTASDGQSLFIGFQEPEHELRANAESVGMDVSAIEMVSLSPDEAFFTEHQSYDVFAASDVEQDPLVDAVIEAVDRVKPTRVFIDSLTQLQFLTADIHQYRKQVMSLLRYLTGRGATVVFSSESTQSMPDDDLQFLSDGVISLSDSSSSATLVIQKYRGSGFVSGNHQYRIDETGFCIFPKMRPPQSQLVGVAPRQLSSGNEDFDTMLRGGLESSTVTLIAGPTGVGKSTLAGAFALEATRSGRRAAFYIFEEELNTFFWRMKSLEMPVDESYNNGSLILEQVEPLRFLADEFTDMVRRHTEEESVDVVIIDSINALDIALKSAEQIGRSLHALTKALVRTGVTVILVNENKMSTDELRVSERDISYLADNVIYLRYIQPNESLQKLIGVLKKRLSGFDNEQRLFEIVPGGFEVKAIPPDIADRVFAGSKKKDRS